MNKIIPPPPRGPMNWQEKTLTTCMVLVLIFVIYEIIEGLFFEESVFHFLKIGAIVTLIALLVALYLIRYHIPRFHQEFLEITLKPEGADERMVFQMCRWLIGMRWIAFVASLTILFVVVSVFEVIEEKGSYLPLAICVALIGLKNLFFSSFTSRWPPRQNIHIQLFSDVILLTFLLHFSGGAENPLFMLYFFHILIASILMSSKETYFFALVVCLLFVSLVSLEYFEILTHHTLKIFPHHSEGVPLLYALSLMGAFVAITFLLTYFASFLAENLRREIRKEKERTDQLIQATKMAIIGELIGYIAHEINNPIGIITLKIKNLLSELEEDFPGHIKRDLEKIDLHTDRVSKLVKNLLQFTRRSLGKGEEICLPDAIQETIDLVGPRFKMEGIELKSQIPPDLPSIRGSSIELQQILLNLINNGLDAMKPGGILTIRVSKAREAVLIEVEDTGSGISPADRERIFEPFFSTKNTRGLGLGLAISSMLVKSQGGAIEVESTPGQGTLFKVHLPLS